MTSSNPFTPEIDFEYGVAMSLFPGLRRFVAQNPGPLTFKGTNVYVLGQNELAIIDPGPHDEAHVEALLKALPGEKISKIFLTHAHKDHCGGLELLRERTGASTYGFAWSPFVRGAYRKGAGDELVKTFADNGFKPDCELADGDEVEGDGWTLRAVHTPGHAPDHLCYSLPDEKALFTGDHIMPWSTTVIAPPEGNMRDYMASLSKLAQRDDELYLPGHGGRVRHPKRLLRAYTLHRQWREESILKNVREGQQRIDQILPVLYRDLDEELKPAASLSILAHLLHLVEKGKLLQTEGLGLDASFAERKE